jgi:predicted amidohydrolase YtcJ
VGKADTLEQKYTAHEVIDAGGHAVYPGFIDAHSHFYSYGLSLQDVKLENTKSWQEAVDSVNTFARKNPEGMDSWPRLGPE